MKNYAFFSNMLFFIFTLSRSTTKIICFKVAQLLIDRPRTSVPHVVSPSTAFFPPKVTCLLFFFFLTCLLQTLKDREMSLDRARINRV